jgi:hypothetical protein
MMAFKTDAEIAKKLSGVFTTCRTKIKKLREYLIGIKIQRLAKLGVNEPL